MTEDAPAAAPAAGRRRHYHHILMQSFLAGMTTEAAAEAAKVSRRTASTWKQENRAALAEAEAETVSVALQELRRGLLGAAQRLRREIEDQTNGPVGVRAALGLLQAHANLDTIARFEERLTELERIRGQL